MGVSRNSHHHALTTQTEYAHKYQVGMHMHLLEPPYQMEYAQCRTGTTWPTPTWVTPSIPWRR
ncbi:MAG: hypothetical protein ACKO63_11145 [Nodosilinea sp.]